MNGLKRFTQSITAILIFLISCIVLFVFALVLEFTGWENHIEQLRQTINPDSKIFWFNTLIGFIYGLSSTICILLIYKSGTEKEYFYSSNYDSSPNKSVDKSGLVILSIIFLTLFIFMSWLVLIIISTIISILIPNMPFYLFWH